MPHRLTPSPPGSGNRAWPEVHLGLAQPEVGALLEAGSPGVEAQARRGKGRQFSGQDSTQDQSGPWVRGQRGAGVGRQLCSSLYHQYWSWVPEPSLHRVPFLPHSPRCVELCRPLPPHAQGSWPRTAGPGSIASSGLRQPLCRMVAGALPSSPTGFGIELPIIVHYCWQLQSLAALRGNWPDCRGAGWVGGALPAFSTSRPSDR